MPRKFKPVTQREFRRVLSRYTNAIIGVREKGTQMPEDWAEIEMEYIEATSRMDNVIYRLMQAKMEEKR